MPSSPADFYFIRQTVRTPFPGAIDRFHHFLCARLSNATSVVLAVYIQVLARTNLQSTPGFPVQVPALRGVLIVAQRMLDIRGLTQLLE